MDNLKFPNGIDAAEFLQSFWQQRPLLLRQALPRTACPLTPDELAGLACDDAIESRLVLEQGGSMPWEVLHGPFDAERFAALGDTHWTLLLQDVDKYLGDISSLIDYFKFIPSWRVDDVMISYASDQGSVGPHIDEYDVFLLQARGKRRWQICSAALEETECIPGLELNILARFESDQEWILEPGDMLYLPPRIAHWGVALGECMTCSIGFRAPSGSELVTAWCEAMIENRSQETRYRDPKLRPQRHVAEIQPEACDQVRGLIQSYLDQDQESFRRWFGRFATEPKPQFTLASPRFRLSTMEFVNSFHDHGLLSRHDFARLSFLRGTEDVDYLFANGQDYSLAKEYADFLALITATRRLEFARLSAWMRQPACAQLLNNLFNDGVFIFDDDDERI